MRCGIIPTLAPLLVALACAADSDPAAIFSPQYSVATAPGRAAESLYRIETRAAGIFWDDISAMSDDLEEIGGRLYAHHLAVIETARENRKVSKLLPDGQSCWLGAYQSAGSGSWYWFTQAGPWDGSTYTNWSKNEPRDRFDDEPNGSGGDISYLELNPDGTWNDVADGTGSCFIVELEPVSGD